ncbi:MAG: hypothetical protein HY849_06925 [Nitrosomonadales bacterium]|nr:hypothetical protein [Nitrosomonadales bacterium]
MRGLQLRWPHSSELALTFTLISGSALVLSSEYLIEQAEQQRQSVQQRLFAAHHNVASARADQEQLPALSALYRTLQARQVIGAAEPLNWQAQLEALRLQTPGLRYTLAAQQPYAALPPGQFIQTLSQVKLQLDLLHEGQLFDVLDKLRASEVGWFLLERCSLERTEPDMPTSRLNAECVGGWLNLHRAETT